MIRVILRRVNGAPVAHLQAPAEISHATIDIDAPEVEEALTVVDTYETISVVGVEVIPTPTS